MNLNNFTIKSQESIQRAQQISMENQTQNIELGHILKGIFEVDENVLNDIYVTKERSFLNFCDFI